MAKLSQLALAQVCRSLAAYWLSRAEELEENPPATAAEKVAEVQPRPDGTAASAEDSPQESTTSNDAVVNPQPSPTTVPPVRAVFVDNTDWERLTNEAIAMEGPRAFGYMKRLRTRLLSARKQELVALIDAEYKRRNKLQAENLIQDSGTYFGTFDTYVRTKSFRLAVQFLDEELSSMNRFVDNLDKHVREELDEIDSTFVQSFKQRFEAAMATRDNLVAKADRAVQDHQAEVQSADDRAIAAAMQSETPLPGARKASDALGRLIENLEITSNFGAIPSCLRTLQDPPVRLAAIVRLKGKKAYDELMQRAERAVAEQLHVRAPERTGRTQRA